MTAQKLSGWTRVDILNAALAAGKKGAHIAPSLSLVEICLAAIKNFNDNKDNFILSKGHGALGYYAVMHQLKMISGEQFNSFEQDGGDFPGQPSRSINNKIEFNSGTLGVGLSYGVGNALAKKYNKSEGLVYVLLGDGELNEGSNWEAVSLAARLKLDNLIALVDNNNLQSDGKCEDIFNLNLEKIFEAHGWNVIKCDGHSIVEIEESIKNRKPDVPNVILAQTVKGKGVSFMENNNAWHHQVLKEAEHEQAINEVKERYGLR